MAPAPKPFASDTSLPAKADVVIIGGGIIGAATALELAERGIDVVLCEKGIIAGEQSSRNWGWCRQMGRDEREIPLAKLSLHLWRDMNQRVGGETGFDQCGILYLCNNDKELAEREQWYTNDARPHGLATRLISSVEAGELAPGSSSGWRGGMFTPDDGRAEPQLATPSIAQAARNCGAKLFTGCAARGIEQSSGNISSVVTEKGTIKCDTVVLAGGAWSRRFCTNLGLFLPQLTVTSSALSTAPIETPLNHSLAGSDFALRKRLDGGYTIAHARLSIADIVPDSFRLFTKFLPALKSEARDLRLRLGRRFFEEAGLARHWPLDQPSPFEKIRVLDPPPVNRVLDKAVTALKAGYPVFEPMVVKESWGGAIDVTPDAVPVISAVNTMPGFYLATGFSGHGFGIGPGAGKLVADLVTGSVPCVDPEPFAYDRLV